MIDAKLIEMLRCPIDGNRLELADAETVSRVNDAITRGEVRDRQDQPIGDPIDGGLISPELGVLYPIRQDIPSLVADEAIKLPAHSS